MRPPSSWACRRNRPRKNSARAPTTGGTAQWPTPKSPQNPRAYHSERCHPEQRSHPERRSCVILSGAPKARSRRAERNYAHRSLFEKLGVTAASRVALVGSHDESFVAELNVRLAKAATARPRSTYDLVFVRVDRPPDLSAHRIGGEVPQARRRTLGVSSERPRCIADGRRGSSDRTRRRAGRQQNQRL